VYKIHYLLDDFMLSKEFKTFDEAALYGIKLPFDSVIEIKQYDTNETYNFQNEPDSSSNGC
jgi:hypothetical protein